MAQPTGRRKLAAILMADVVEYGRHMEEDESATIHTLQAHRAVFSKHIQQRNGRVVDANVDAIMAAFESVVDAVAASVATQREVATANDSLPDPRKMQFRIGINLGDIVEEPDSIYGDGVTVAARLETLAEPGGICISRNVHDQVEGKLPLEFRHFGAHGESAAGNHLLHGLDFFLAPGTCRHFIEHQKTSSASDVHPLRPPARRYGGPRPVRESEGLGRRR